LSCASEQPNALRVSRAASLPKSASIQDTTQDPISRTVSGRDSGVGLHALVSHDLEPKGVNVPYPTLIISTRLHAVVTITMPGTNVTVLGMPCDSGDRTHDAASRAYQESNFPSWRVVLTRAKMTTN
jgi:hypothetical protein